MWTMSDDHTADARGVWNRRGVALPLVLAILLAMGFIGAAAVAVSRTDSGVSRLVVSTTRADAAATAGIEHGAAMFLIEGPTGPSWPVTGNLDGFTYTVTAVRDSYDYNGDDLAGPVSWDGITYHEDGTGDAVWEVTSRAENDAIRAVQRLRISSRTAVAQPESALVTNSSSQLMGSITVSGLNHDTDGNVIDADDLTFTGACEENKPAVVVTDLDDIVDIQGSVDTEGNELFAALDYIVHDETVDIHTPEDALGLDPGALDHLIQDADTYTPPETISGVEYVDGDYGSGAAGGNDVNGSGVLIVHNPKFDPREHDPDDPLYDPAKASDPEYAPANLGNINDGTFRGIIIADRIDKIDGNIDIIGSVISLTEIDVTKVGAGTARILYSCEAIEQAANKIVAVIDRLTWVAD